MGLFAAIFGKKSAPLDNKLQNTTGSIKPIFTKGFIRIEEIKFFGQYSESASGKWIIAWRDSDPEQGRGGHRDSGPGKYVLIDATGNKIILQGEIERPNNGKIANNGWFSLEDWHFGSELSGTLYVFSPSGEKKIQRIVRANIFNSALSENGKFAVLQTANSPTDDGNRLILLSTEEGKDLFATHPKTGWADGYEFKENPTHLVVIHKNIGKFQYDASGTFLDTEKYQAERLRSNRYEIILPAVAEILKTDSIFNANENAQKALDAVLAAKSLGAVSDKGWGATAFKLEGQAYEQLGRFSEAISAYEEALTINPKIGVKQKVASLKKQISKIK